MNNSFENIVDTDAALGADRERVVRVNGQNVFDLFLNEVDLRGGQIDFVDDRENGEIVSGGEKGVGDGLRFDPLRGVNNEQCAFARGERTGNFVGKIHVSRSVDQIQSIGVAVFRFVMQPNAFGLDGDAALALEVHGVENLRGHFALGEATGYFDQAVGKRGLAAIDWS